MAKGASMLATEAIGRAWAPGHGPVAAGAAGPEPNAEAPERIVRFWQRHSGGGWACPERDEVAIA